MTFLISFAYMLCSIFAVFGVLSIIACLLSLLRAEWGTSDLKTVFTPIIICIIITAILFAGKESLKELKAEKCPVHNCGEKQCLK